MLHSTGKIIHVLTKRIVQKINLNFLEMGENQAALQLKIRILLFLLTITKTLKRKY